MNVINTSSHLKWGLDQRPDGLVVDVTGVAHLFGGEAALLADANERLAARKLTARLAIAPTAGAAWALAHYGPESAILPAGGGMLDELSVAALRLDPATLLVLRRLGLKRVGELSGVARDALARRFRVVRTPAANPLIRLDQLLGRVPEPLLPVRAAAVPLVQRRLIEPIRHRELLDQVMTDLAGDLVRVLEGQALGARRLELALWKVDGGVLQRRLELAAATREAAHITRLFAAKLDDIDAGFGIELARLTASWCEPLALSQRDFEAAAEAHGTSLAAFVDRLSVRLGADAVRRPELVASHWPERAQRWLPPLEPERGAQESLAFHARPLKLLDRPELIAVIHASPDGLPRRFRWRGQVHEVTRAEGPERIAPEWWRERGAARLRDYYRVEDDDGGRFWLFRDEWPESRSPWSHEKSAAPFVTVSREAGSGGSSFARILVRKLNAEAAGGVFWRVFEGDVTARMLRENRLPVRIARFLPEQRVPELSATIGELIGLHPNLWSLVQKTNETMRQLAAVGHVILVGRGANFATAGSRTRSARRRSV